MMQTLALPIFPAGEFLLQKNRFRFASPIPSTFLCASYSRKVTVDGCGEGDRMCVIGMGFSGRYIGGRLMQEREWNVSGTCRSDAKKKELNKMGIDAFLFDSTKDRLENLKSLKEATHLLLSIPPAEAGNPLFHSLEKLRDFLGNGNLRWMGYLSSTSVYGDCGGALVNEDYPANPMNESSKARLVTEKKWLSLGNQLGVSTYVFRLGGIYGPGRSAIDTLLRKKQPTSYQRMRRSKRFTARIHVADVYEAVKASFDVSKSGTYNIVDDNPASRAEVFAFARNLIEEKWAGQVLIDESREATRLDSASKAQVRKGEKRVSNVRMKTQLGVNLTFPDYKSGLLSILNSYDTRFHGFMKLLLSKGCCC